MKLQRYYVDKYDIGRGVCYNEDVVVLEGKYNALEAENAALHAECDRLTAMLGPQKVLSAEEVTEAGHYWHREGQSDINDWDIVEVGQKWPWIPKIFAFVVCGESVKLYGQFIGPINMPEVQG